MSQTINVGKRNIEVYHFTGKVAESQKNMETKISGGGGGGYSYQGTGGSAPVRITSTTIIHDQIFIVDKDGKEKSLQLKGFDLACRESNIVSAMWAIVEGNNEGPYFAVINHTTDKAFVNDKIVRDIVIKSVRLVNIDNQALGCLLVIGVMVILALIWWPLVIAFIAYAIYFEFAVIRKGIKKFKSEVVYPQPGLW